MQPVAGSGNVLICLVLYLILFYISLYSSGSAAGPISISTVLEGSVPGFERCTEAPLMSLSVRYSAKTREALMEGSVSPFGPQYDSILTPSEIPIRPLLVPDSFHPTEYRNPDMTPEKYSGSRGIIGARFGSNEYRTLKSIPLNARNFPKSRACPLAVWGRIRYSVALSAGCACAFSFVYRKYCKNKKACKPSISVTQYSLEVGIR